MYHKNTGKASKGNITGEKWVASKCYSQHISSMINLNCINFPNELS